MKLTNFILCFMFVYCYLWASGIHLFDVSLFSPYIKIWACITGFCDRSRMLEWSDCSMKEATYTFDWFLVVWLHNFTQKQQFLMLYHKKKPYWWIALKVLEKFLFQSNGSWHKIQLYDSFLSKEYDPVLSDQDKMIRQGNVGFCFAKWFSKSFA